MRQETLHILEWEDIHIIALELYGKIPKYRESFDPCCCAELYMSVYGTLEKSEEEHIQDFISGKSNYLDNYYILCDAVRKGILVEGNYLCD